MSTYVCVRVFFLLLLPSFSLLTRAWLMIDLYPSLPTTRHSLPYTQPPHFGLGRSPKTQRHLSRTASRVLLFASLSLSRCVPAFPRLYRHSISAGIGCAPTCVLCCCPRTVGGERCICVCVDRVQQQQQHAHTQRQHKK